MEARGRPTEQQIPHALRFPRELPGLKDPRPQQGRRGNHHGLAGDVGRRTRSRHRSVRGVTDDDSGLRRHLREIHVQRPGESATAQRRHHLSRHARAGVVVRVARRGRRVIADQGRVRQIAPVAHIGGQRRIRGETAFHRPRRLLETQRPARGAQGEIRMQPTGGCLPVFARGEYHQALVRQNLDVRE